MRIRVHATKAAKFESDCNALLRIMPIALSVDLRWRIVWLCHYKQYTVNEVAELLVVCTKTVRRILKRYDESGTVDPTEQKHGPERKLDAFEEMTLVQSLMNKPSAYLDELQTDLYNISGTVVSLSTICRTLQRLGFTRKKLQHVVLRRSEIDRAEFVELMTYIDPNMIVWVDETGSTRREGIRSYGYSLRGMTPVSFKVEIRGKRYSVITAMSTRGIEDIDINEGTTNGDKFTTFLEQHILPNMQPFNGSNPRSILVLDNASIHHVNRVFELVERRGVMIQFMPAYSPDFMPLEEVFSKVKYFLKRSEVLFTSTDNPALLLTMAFASVTQDDCLGYIHHAGY